jgi:hypothetical protein
VGAAEALQLGAVAAVLAREAQDERERDQNERGEDAKEECARHARIPRKLRSDGRKESRELGSLREQGRVPDAGEYTTLAGSTPAAKTTAIRPSMRPPSSFVAYPARAIDSFSV